MTTSADARVPGVLRRRPLLLAGIVAIGIAAVGTGGWFARRSPAPLTPPPVPPNQAEPDVTTFVEKVRERALKEPHSAEAWGIVGQAFLANDMEPESRVCFAEAERLDKDNPRWPYFQAVILLNQGERETALPYLQRAVQRGETAAPDNPVPPLVLAETLLALGKVEEAEEYFHRVLARFADEARVHYDLALAASARQDWETSRTHLLRCTGNSFAQQKASIQLAAICQRLGDSAGAEKYRRQANRIPMDQDWVDPFVTEYLTWAVKKRNRYRHAEALEVSGRPQDAMRVLLPMLKEFPDDYLPRVTLSKILGRLGDHKGAEQVLREALRLAPEKVQVHYYLSLVLFTQAEEVARNGERARAEKLYGESVQRARGALAIKPDYGFAYMTLGLALKGLGQRADALTALRQAVRCNPEHAELHFYLGEVLAEEDRKSEAREQLEQAIEMSPPGAAWKPSALARLAAIAPNSNPKKTP